MDINLSLATPSDIPGLVECSRLAAQEAGPQWLERFNQAHAERHMSRLVIDGHCFIAKRLISVIGLIACSRIDTGFAFLEDLETAHIYVRPEERKSLAIFMLFDAVEEFACHRGIKVLFHQVDYTSVIDGRKGNTARVETLFKRRRYEGPIDIVYGAPEFTRVGLTYLFDAAMRRPAPVARLSEARRGNQPSRGEHAEQPDEDNSGE